MKKIAFIIGGLPFGGVENWLFDMALRMKRSSSHTCRIFNISGTGVKMADFAAAGLDVVCIGKSNAAASTHRLDTAFRLRRELKRFRPDIIHTQHFSGDYFGRIAALGLGIPVITHLHNVKREKKHFRRFANRFLSRFTDAYITISKAAEETLKKDHNMIGRRHFLLYNAIDTSRLDCDAYDLRSMYGIHGAIIIGIGRYVKQKNFENLIGAMKILVDQGREASLVLVGEGSRRELYEKQIRELDLAGRVILTGYRSEVGAFLRGADIMAMPSLFEGFGNVHLEAMHCGVPGVISQFVPSLEIGAEACVVSDCSAESIASGIASLLDDPEKYRECVDRGRRIVPEYAIERYLERLYDVYEEVLVRP